MAPFFMFSCSVWRIQGRLHKTTSQNVQASNTLRSRGSRFRINLRTEGKAQLLTSSQVLLQPSSPPLASVSLHCRPVGPAWSPPFPPPTHPNPCRRAGCSSQGSASSHLAQAAPEFMLGLYTGLGKGQKVRSPKWGTERGWGLALVSKGICWLLFK